MHLAGLPLAGWVCALAAPAAAVWEQHCSFNRWECWCNSKHGSQMLFLELYLLSIDLIDRLVVSFWSVDHLGILTCYTHALLSFHRLLFPNGWWNLLWWPPMAQWQWQWEAVLLLWQAWEQSQVSIVDASLFVDCCLICMCIPITPTHFFW